MRCRHLFAPAALALVGAAVWISSAGSASAAVQTFDIMDANRTTGWQLEYDDTQVSVTSFTGNKTGSLEGRLDIAKVFNNLNAITLKFIETADQQKVADNFGLRINLFESIKNMSGKDWVGFKMDLVDASAVSGQGDDNHPGFAHFHPKPGAFMAPPFNLVSGGDKAKTLVFANNNMGGGNFLDGATQNWSNFGLHQFEDMGIDRSFTLVETPYPTPEPGTIIAWSLLGICLGAARWRCSA